MAKLRAADARRVRDIEAALATVVHGGAPALETLMDPLHELLGTEKAVAYTLRERSQGLGVERVYGKCFRAREFEPAFDRWMQTQSIQFGLFNPMRPEPRQRNVALTLGDLGARETPMTRELWPSFDLAHRDQLRVLVCDGPSLLAWVGALQPTPFAARQKRLFSALIRPLRRRLRWERHVGQMARTRAALEVALEAIGRAAFVVGPAGEIHHANAAGRAMVDRDRGGVTRSLCDAVWRRPSEVTFELTRFRVEGAPDGYLALLNASGRERAYASRVAWAAIRWGLSPRQRQVLEMLARGLSNQTIAAALGVSERAVELHVSAIFDRAGVHSRATLAAELLWRD